MRLGHGHADGAYDTRNEKSETAAAEVSFSRCLPGSREHSRDHQFCQRQDLSGQLLKVLQKRQQSETRTLKRHGVHFRIDTLVESQSPTLALLCREPKSQNIVSSSIHHHVLDLTRCGFVAMYSTSKHHGHDANMTSRHLRRDPSCKATLKTDIFAFDLKQPCASLLPMCIRVLGSMGSHKLGGMYCRGSGLLCIVMVLVVLLVPLILGMDGFFLTFMVSFSGSLMPWMFLMIPLGRLLSNWHREDLVSSPSAWFGSSVSFSCH